ncbi:uncharacterized protein [Littorina saxatilis]|uniref:uncharacterized protein isoform X2 n=1 Tax=Littorina saxatilis TaxID=31220 RepID=UPI0038B62D18
MLNEFGLVQHAVLQSPDHKTVHVIYGHTNKHFVHSELTEELKTRTGLQLVPSQSRVATSSSTADSVLIVIVDRHDSVTDRLLQQAVETSGHPDTNTLFIQKGKYCPDWVEEKLPRCTLMSYRRPEMRHPSYVLPRQSSVSAGASTGCKDVRTLFWDNVLTIIDDKSRHSRGSSDASVDSTVEDKTMSQHDLCANSKSETAMSTKIPQTSDKDSGHENNIFVDSTHDTKDKPTFLARDTDKKVSVTTVSTQSVDKAVCNKPKEGGAHAGHKSPPDAENAVASHILLSRPDSGLVAGSSSDAVPEIYSQVRLSNATPPKEEAESTHVTSQPTWKNDGIDIPPPLVSMCWHYNATFHSEGGVLRKPGSDVILHVPPGAVNTDRPVVIHTAVCADVDRVHNVLGLSDEEQIVSPLAEYWAGPDFSFERPVCITLPLCLPPDPDLSLLRVYRVSRRQDGHMSVNRVKPKVDDEKDDAQNEADSNRSRRFVSLSSATEKGQRPDVTEYAQTSPDENRPEARVMNEANLDHSEAAFHQDRLLSDERAFFHVTSKGQVEVTTDCFSGYGCAYCGRNQGPPVLIAMVNGSLERTSETTLGADVDLYVWDKRIEVADFREKYKIRIDKTQLQGTAVSLLKEPQNTNFYQRLTVLGPSVQQWTHLTTADGEIGNPVIQEKDLEAVLGCDDYGCSRRRSAPPLLVQWNLMAPAALMSDSSMRMTINLSHVMSGVDPTWKDNGKIERSTSMTFKIPKPVMTETEMPGEPNAEQWRHLLSALNTGQLESVAEDLNVGQSERMHRKSWHYDGQRVPETHRQYMVDMCCRQDAAKVRAAIVALIHHQEQRLTTSQSALLENGAFHSHQPTDSPDATSGVDDLSCPPPQRRRADMSGDTSAFASVGETADAPVSDSSNALVWDSSTACVPRDSADFHQPHPSVPEEFIAEPCNHDSEMVMCFTETRKQLTVRGKGVGPPVSLAGIITGTIIPSLHGQAPQLALMEPVPDAVFQNVDNPIIIYISRKLSSDKAMLFFLGLGLSHDLYTKATKKWGESEEAYFECFVLLGQCKNTEINVEMLVKALEDMDRYDIIDKVREIQERTVSTVSKCE